MDIVGWGSIGGSGSRVGQGARLGTQRGPRGLLLTLVWLEG
jgi:hypothetical protein